MHSFTTSLTGRWALGLTGLSRRRTQGLLWVLVWILAGCTHGTITPDPEITESETTTEMGMPNSSPEQASRQYVGLSESEARALALQRGTPFRVVQRDGQRLMVTFDFVRGRINAEVTEGVVTSVVVEGANLSGQHDSRPQKTPRVADSCLVFFDGCNHCRRGAPGGAAACTKKACATYEPVRCLDP